MSAQPVRPPIVILGGFLSCPGLYRAMQRTLADEAGVRVSVVNVGVLDWLPTVSTLGWRAILRKLDRTIRDALRESGRESVVLVGHSSGGVLGRLYLSPEPFEGDVFAGRDRVSRLLTLGSPNTNQRIGPIRRWVDQQYPGACFAPDVSYTSVAGKLVEGRARGGVGQRLAYHAYRQLCGEGAVWGDGLVPVTCALLAGADAVVLDGVGHAPVLARRWFGSPDVVRQWWGCSAS